LFLAWCVEKAPEFLFFEGIPEDQIVARLAARGFVLMMFVVVCVLIKLKKERLTQPAVLGVSE
jgi:hypothetical protein